MLKKYLVLLLVVILVFSLTACKNEDKPKPTEKEDVTLPFIPENTKTPDVTNPVETDPIETDFEDITDSNWSDPAAEYTDLEEDPEPYTLEDAKITSYWFDDFFGTGGITLLTEDGEEKEYDAFAADQYPLIYFIQYADYLKIDLICQNLGGIDTMIGYLAFTKDGTDVTYVEDEIELRNKIGLLTEGEYTETLKFVNYTAEYLRHDYPNRDEEGNETDPIVDYELYATLNFTKEDGSNVFIKLMLSSDNEDKEEELKDFLNGGTEFVWEEMHFIADEEYNINFTVEMNFFDDYIATINNVAQKDA